jgi:hypothetical protein
MYPDISSGCKVVGHTVHVLIYSLNSFYNTLWLILNDVIMGIAFGGFLQDNAVALSELFVQHLEVRTV